MPLTPVAQVKENVGKRGICNAAAAVAASAPVRCVAVATELVLVLLLMH